MSTLGNLFLTATSLAPVFFVYAALAFVDCEYVWGLALTLIGVALFLLCLGFFRYARKYAVRVSTSFRSVEIADKETVGILVLYLMPLLRTNFAGLDLVILIPAAAIFLALSVTGMGYHFNPLLALIGWKFYKVVTPKGVGHLLITRQAITGTDLEELEFVVGVLTDHTVIDLGDRRTIKENHADAAFHCTSG